MRRLLFGMLFLVLISGESRAVTILIDPGHGGDDTGAKGRVVIGKKKAIIIREKDLTLMFARRIHAALSKKYSAFLTRSMDRTVTLAQRAELADKLKADLFLSIHMNSGLDKAAHGLEIFYLDNHNDVAVRKVEDAENKSVRSDDPMVEKILIDLVIQKTVATSKPLAQMVHRHLISKMEPFEMKDRGVKPGLLYVLALSKRPGILLEAGFMSNPSELRKLQSPGYQEMLAEALVDAVDEFVKKNGMSNAHPK